ncbi:MAG: asparaginase [Rhodocyclaceae bacterium]|jgi:L-asparaginase II|nr:asparaginase [Rhodocyclaceae bacterium]
MTQPLPAHVTLAYTTRGGHPENMHWGSVAVVDADGHLLAAAGEPSVRTFARSTIKPFQALPFVHAGGLARYAWGVREAAMLCASHCAEAPHVDTVVGMLASAGNRIEDLGCGAHTPMAASALCEPAPPGSAWTAIHNNCSGKHAGFLASCRLHGWSLPDYLEPDHALQVSVRKALSDFAQIDVDGLPRGVDGCSAPIYALPLERLAFSFARLARGDAGSAVLRDAMRSEPRLISGSDRFDLHLANYGAGDWVAKSGADGLQLIASVSRGVAIAVKLSDGNLRALNAVVIAVLRQLGWLNTPLPPALSAFDAPVIRNWRGNPTGEVVCCVALAHG